MNILYIHGYPIYGFNLTLISRGYELLGTLCTIPVLLLWFDVAQRRLIYIYVRIPGLDNIKDNVYR